MFNIVGLYYCIILLYYKYIISQMKLRSVLARCTHCNAYRFSCLRQHVTSLESLRYNPHIYDEYGEWRKEWRNISYHLTL